MDNKVIIPLDLEYSDALSMAEVFDPAHCRLKIGSQLFTSSGPKIIQELKSMGFDIFLDLKFHDIPNTVYEAVNSAAELGVWMVNVHASGGKKMLEAAKRALIDYEDPPLLIAVTILTSLSQTELKDIGLGNLSDQVLRLASLSYECELDGVVCASTDTQAIKQKFGDKFLTVTPGIRPTQSDIDDQSRVSTPKQAIQNGSDYLVIGRPITASNNPAEALKNIYKEII
ncbi:MAG: orotidine-5'-phosphate decarboxylase [SAR86 cluster bacterium]|nr:orotidine-5'-phosphate decarboxylase [SAR86 cluster bacterium]